MFKRMRTAIGEAVIVAFELAGFVVSLAGTTVAIVLGKFFAAIVLGAITLGVFLRLSGRRKPVPAELLPTPPWLQLTCAFLAVIEVAVLTEATNLPVRLIQPGFEKMNWVLVIVALLVLYFIQLRFFRSVMLRRNDPLP